MKEVYRLYKVSPTEKNMKELSNERFTFFGMDNGYIYKNGPCPVIGGKEIGEKESYRELGEEETSWLYECNVELLAEETLKCAREISLDVEKKLNELEAMLKENAKEGDGAFETSGNRHTDE